MHHFQINFLLGIINTWFISFFPVTDWLWWHLILDSQGEREVMMGSTQTAEKLNHLFASIFTPKLCSYWKGLGWQGEKRCVGGNPFPLLSFNFCVIELFPQWGRVFQAQCLPCECITSEQPKDFPDTGASGNPGSHSGAFFLLCSCFANRIISGGGQQREWEREPKSIWHWNKLGF